MVLTLVVVLVVGSSGSWWQLWWSSFFVVVGRDFGGVVVGVSVGFVTNYLFDL